MTNLGAFLVIALVVKSSILIISAERPHQQRPQHPHQHPQEHASPPLSSTSSGSSSTSSSRFPNILTPLRNMFTKRLQHHQTKGGLLNGLLPLKRYPPKDLTGAETNNKRQPGPPPPQDELGIGGYRPYLRPGQGNVQQQEPYQQAEEDRPVSFGRPYQFSYEMNGRPGGQRQQHHGPQQGFYNSPAGDFNNAIQDDTAPVAYASFNRNPDAGHSYHQPQNQSPPPYHNHNNGNKRGKGNNGPRRPLFQYPSLRGAGNQKGFRPSRPDLSFQGGQQQQGFNQPNEYDSLGFLPGETFNPAQELGTDTFEHKPRDTRGSEPQIITLEDIQKQAAGFNGHHQSQQIGFDESAFGQSRPHMPIQQQDQQPQYQHSQPQPLPEMHNMRPHHGGRPFRRGRGGGKGGRFPMHSFSKQVPMHSIPNSLNGPIPAGSQHFRNPFTSNNNDANTMGNNPIYQSRPLRSPIPIMKFQEATNYITGEHGEQIPFFQHTQKPDQLIMDSNEEILYGKPMLEMSSTNQQQQQQSHNYQNEQPTQGIVRGLRKPISTSVTSSTSARTSRKKIIKPYLLKATTKIPSFKKLPSSIMATGPDDSNEPQQAASSYGNFGGGGDGGGGGFNSNNIDEFSGSNNGDRILFHVSGHKGPTSYRWGYDTGKGYNRMFRFEEKDETGYVKGKYGYEDKHGKMKVVNYEAHPEAGYHEQPSGH